MGIVNQTVMQGVTLRGRGAAENAAGRFERGITLAFDDGWDAPQTRVLRTEVRTEVSRSAISYNASPDLPFDRSINPYRGCEHGCSYCYARPSHAYLNLSPGLDFETKLIARPNIAEILARELGAKSYRPAVIAIGTNTDPYQPIESEHRLMPQILAVLAAHNHPVAITTKGSGIVRDIPQLAPMAARGLVRVGISITTLDPKLSRALEPRAPAPAHRLRTIRALADAGIPVRVMVAPVIPGLTDPEMEAILSAAQAAGASAASFIPLRLPREVSELFQAWLERHAPTRAAKVMARVREMHGGQDYNPTFGTRFRGTGVWANLLAMRFSKTIDRLGLAVRQPPLRCDLFAVPTDQLSLF